jgi:fucose permease
MTCRKSFQRTKFACYSAYFTMSSVFALPPLLFVTFHEMYGVSYTLLGTLVLTNFCTQLLIDLVFSFFSKYFNVKLAVRIMPILTSVGLFLYAMAPVLFPNAIFWGLFLGTIIFSVSAGLSEVLLSPVIAAIPSDNPQGDMSLLHSLYAFGVFFVVTVSTVFLKLFSTESWMYLTLLFAALPLISAVQFMLSPMPDMSASGSESGTKRSGRRGVGLALCVLCIFFGSCAENVMSSWISSFMENALHIDKAFGDILGVAMFAILLGVARFLYGKFGKNIFRVLVLGMSGAVVCYLVAGLSSNMVVALISCAVTGLFTSMLWPGSLIMMEENLPGVGVAAYALMASGGDLGASVAPQLMGIVVDGVSASSFAADLAVRTGMTPEEIGMKAGMLVNAIFPLIGVFLLIFVIRYFRKGRGARS